MNEENVNIQEEGKQQEQESKVWMPGVEEELEQFKYADTVITCQACGKQTTLELSQFINVEVGLKLPILFTTNKHALALACSHCGKEGTERVSESTALTLHMIKAKTPPAHDFNYDNKYNVPEEIELTWTAGENVLKYEILVKNLDKPLSDGQELEFEKIGETNEPKYTLEFTENTSYQVIVNSWYIRNDNEVEISSAPVFLSTKDEPETPVDIDSVDSDPNTNNSPTKEEK